MFRGSTTKEGILLMLTSIGFFILWSTAIERFVPVRGLGGVRPLMSRLGVGEKKVNSTNPGDHLLRSKNLTLLPIRQTDASSADPSFFLRVPIPEMWQMRL
jgi:hypothetical protein